MHYKDFLFEVYELNDDDKKLLEDIKKQCKKTIFSKDKILWRGMHKQLDGINIMNVHVDRKPRDSSLDYHNAMNKMFMKKFKLALRSETMFGTLNRLDALEYGVTYAVIPLDDSDYYSSKRVWDLFELSRTSLVDVFLNVLDLKVKDLDAYIEKYNLPKNQTLNLPIVLSIDEDAFNEVFEKIVNLYSKSNDLPQDSTGEIMVDTVQYYITKAPEFIKTYDQLLKYLEDPYAL